MPVGRPISQYERAVVVAEQSSARAAAQSGDTIAIVQRGVPRWAVLRCPCGCSELLTINLDRRAGPSWKITRRNGTVSLSPSVWLTSGCQSHFILWKNKVWMFREPGERAGEQSLPEDIDIDLRREWRRNLGQH